MNSKTTPINEVESYIRNNLARPVNLPLLCKQFGFSLSGLRRKWLATHSTTPKAYMNQLRLEKAKNLLLTTQTNLVGIAHAVGFNDVHYFSRKFKSAYGMAPTYFRQAKV